MKMDNNAAIILSVLVLLAVPISIQAPAYHADADMHDASYALHPAHHTLAHAETEHGMDALSISVDKAEYIPGETVRITGHTDMTVPFEGLEFQVTDPTGAAIVSGNLFPTDGRFSTSVFMTTIQPSYGTYTVTGIYAGQTAMSTFALVEDRKEDVLISLHTDKEVYGLGETVSITGRLNDLWVGSLDISIHQTRNMALGAGSAGGGTAFKILDVVRLEGDGRFEYDFTIPGGNVRLGDYWIKVSQGLGSAAKSILVVDQPDAHALSGMPITVSVDKPSYSLGDKLQINGKIANPEPDPNPETYLVKLAITESADDTILREYTAVPDSSGRFTFETSIVSTAYRPGNYTVAATYEDLAASAGFELVDSLATEWASVEIDKEVYGLGETVSLSGTLPPRGEHTVAISITRPDGTIVNSGASVDRQRFSWQWQTPISEVQQSIKDPSDRSVIASNLGIYKLTVSAGKFSQDILFKVSADPENDSIPEEQLLIGIEKPVYSVGEELKVSGTILAREQRASGTVIPDRVKITVSPEIFSFRHIYESFVYPDRSGNFESTFKLPASVFKEGKYKIKATYIDLVAKTEFSMADDFTAGTAEDVTMMISMDGTGYNPGDTVTITGKPSKLIYVDGIKISVIKEARNGLACGQHACGEYAIPITDIVPNPTGSFTFEFRIQDARQAVGTYEMVMDAPFETKSIVFEVTDDMPAVRPDMPEVEKVNRIPDSHIPIETASRTSDDGTVYPRTLSGSLITPIPMDQPSVNLMVLYESGVCIIGPHPYCHVQESTAPDAGHASIEFDGIKLDVWYSGPDARVEKFEIIPQDMTDSLPESDWTVQVLKSDQWSRFYYKIELW